MGDFTNLETELVFSRYGLFECIKNDGPISDSLRNYGEWGQVELDFLSSLMPSGSTVLDVGANLGIHSRAFSQFVGPTGRVVSVECHPQILKILKLNLERAGHPNLELVQSAAGAQPGSASISLFSHGNRINAGTGSLSAGIVQSPDVVEVPVAPLDDLGLTECALIKVDVEGYEAAVVSGLLNTIERCKPFLYLEFNRAALLSEVMDLREWTGWQFFFVSTRAFNNKNIRSNPRNFFGHARETSLLIAPPGEEISEQLSHDIDIIRILSKEDAVAALISAPRFGTESSSERERELLSSRVDALERMLADVMFRTRAQAVAYDRVADEARREIMESRSWRITKPLRFITNLGKPK